jgi:hypothetical protein
MGKINLKQVKEFREFECNGFTIDVDNMVYRGAKYPKIKNIIYTKDNIGIDVVISYYKGYKGGEYSIRAEEYKIDGDFIVSGTGYFSKKYFTESTERYSIKRLKELCNQFVIEDLTKEIMQDCENWNKNSDTKKSSLTMLGGELFG